MHFILVKIQISTENFSNNIITNTSFLSFNGTPKKPTFTPKHGPLNLINFYPLPFLGVIYALFESTFLINNLKLYLGASLTGGNILKIMGEN